MITNDKSTDITPGTLVYELLENYPGLEDKLIEIAPIFVKLKNPVLRKTIAKITTLRQASVVANIPIADLINSLRKAAGQSSYPAFTSSLNEKSKIPEWILTTGPAAEYNAVDDINNGVHPLARIMGDIHKLEVNQVYRLITPFNPAPLIQKVKDKGFEVWTRESNGNTETFINKSK